MTNTRKISKEAYEKHVSENPNAISYLNTDEELIEWEDQNFFIMRVPDPYKYLEYENYEVLDHFLIIPKNEEIEFIHELRKPEERSLKQARSWLEGRFNNSNYILKEASKSLRSQKILHIHFIVLSSLPIISGSPTHH